MDIQVMELGDWLRQREMRQSRLRHAAGISGETLHRLRHQRPVRVSTMCRVASALGVDVLVIGQFARAIQVWSGVPGQGDL